MSGDPAHLARLAERTRELVADLEATRADVLSLADLNRALRQLLRNQAELLDVLARAPMAPAAEQRASGRVAATPDAPEPEPVVSLEPAPLVPAAASPLNGAATHAAAVEAVIAAGADAPADDDDDRPLAVRLLDEKRVLPHHIARSVVEAFDNRDKSYDKGLDKLNRWVAGGAGTPFQWRGDRAYLNLNGAGAAAVKNYEEQLMSRMGFSRRLGRLDVPGLQGEVIIYERPG
ncbi:MAG: hypothetical protein M9894_23870 [Planctomycetes bacterium]|nr:hypothetical protein [Planctomycetota bacterium]